MKKKMKKILAIMLIAVIAVAGAVAVTPAGAVAGTHNSVNLIYTVADESALSYGVRTSDKTGDVWNTTDVTVSSLLTSGTVVFNVVDLSLCNQSIQRIATVTVTVGKFVGVSSAAKLATYFSSATEGVDYNTDQVVYSAVTSDGTTPFASGVTTLKWAATYKANARTDFSAVANYHDAGSFTVKWDGDANLPADNYEATVTLAVTAN